MGNKKIFTDEYSKRQFELAEKIYNYLEKNYNVSIVQTPSFKTPNGIMSVMTRKCDGLDYNSIISELSEEIGDAEIVYLYEFGIIKSILRSWITIRFAITENTKSKSKYVVKTNMFPTLEMIQEYLNVGVDTIVYKGQKYKISKVNNIINLDLE